MTSPVSSSFLICSSLMSHNFRRSRDAFSSEFEPSETSANGELPRYCLAPLRDQVLLLRGNQVRAVEREQRLALFHQLTDVIHVDLVDPAAHLDVDVRDLRFVCRESARWCVSCAPAIAAPTLPVRTPISCCFPAEIMTVPAGIFASAGLLVRVLRDQCACRSRAQCPACRPCRPGASDRTR